MRSPKLPAALPICAWLSILVALPGPLLNADPPERDDTVLPADARIATYEQLLHSSTIVTADPSPARGRESWDVERYDLVMIPDFATGSLEGIVKITFTSLEMGLTAIELDLYDEFDVTWVQSKSQTLAWSLQNDVLRVTLPRPLDRGYSQTVTVTYKGQPQPAGPLGLAFDTTPDGRPVLATVSEPFYARSWWPCKDTVLDKALVDLRVVVPAQMTVASGGTLESVVDAGANRGFHWSSGYPMSTYNVSMAVTEYASWTEPYVAADGAEFPLEFHVFPEHEEIARYEFGRVAEMIDFFTEKYGPYPFPDEKYGMAEVVLAGAMEHQTMTSYGDFFMTGDRYYEGIVAHELSHHWWGNLLTLSDWDDVWLHEAMATFSDGLWREHVDGRAAYDRFFRQRSAGCCGFLGPISPPVKLFNQTVYQKGAWMLHMLREMIGDHDFFAALRRLTADPDLRYGNYGPAEFIAAFEAQTGQELDWYFDQWLHRTGRPEIAVEWYPLPDEGGTGETLSVRVLQVQEDDPWVFPLRLRFSVGSQTVDRDLWVTGDTTEFTIDLVALPDQIAIDPDQQLLHFDQGVTRVPVPPGASDLPAVLLPNTPNPFNPRTQLRFALDEPARVRLRIFDLRGREVSVLDCGWLEPGTHARVWDGTDRSGASVASGSYLVRMEGVSPTPPAQRITLVR